MVAFGARYLQRLQRCDLHDIRFNGERSCVTIADDGAGMTEAAINEALRFGSQRLYDLDDLGRYGLGLKTASLSQCRRLTVVSRRSPQRNRIAVRQLDLDWIDRTDRWEVTDPQRIGNVDRAAHRLSRAPGTAVISKTKPQTKRPSLYRVLILNDDYTPMEFVVHVLERFFNKDRESATQIMLHVHHHGIGECGVFTYEVAETKVTQVMDFARKHQHPLQCVMEKK